MCPLNKNYLNNVYYNTPQIKEVELEGEEKRKKKKEKRKMKEVWKRENGKG